MAAAMDHDVEVPGRVEVSARTPATTWPAPPSSAGCGRARSCASSSISATDGPACARVPHCAIRPPPPSPAPATAGGRACWIAQRAYLDEFWDCADVEVEGDPTASRRCDSGCSTCCRPAPAPSGAPSQARADRHRLRRPRLLGHRGFRAAGTHLHQTAGRGRRAAVAGPPRWTWPASGRRSSIWRAPVFRGAPSGRGVLGVLAGGHRGVAHQRRHRRCVRALSRCHRR